MQKRKEGTMFEVVIDTGGTFTDALLLDHQEKKITTAKFPTNIDDPSASIMGSTGLLAQQRNLTDQEVLENTTTLVIGTTLSTNCVRSRNRKFLPSPCWFRVSSRQSSCSSLWQCYQCMQLLSPLHFH